MFLNNKILNNLPSNLKSKANWAAFIAVPNLGRQTLKKTLLYLTKKRLNWADFWVNKSDLWNKIGIRTKQVKSIKKFKKDHKISDYYQHLVQKGIRVICFWEKAYPELLKQIDDPPVLIFVKAKQQNLDAMFNQQLAFAVVGTRHMTNYGAYVVKKILSELQPFDPVIVSGFMYGVDVCAHKTALNLGLTTIGILGYGFDYIYPASQYTLFDQLYKKGMIFLTEYPPDYLPKAGNFVQRNRIIAGLSSGVLIPEAAKKSGSLITAGLAADYGREVFITPGQVDNPYIVGLIELANNGALLVNSGREIIKTLRWDSFRQEIKNKQENSVGRKTMKESSAKHKSFFIKGTNFCLDQNLTSKILFLLKNQALTVSAIAYNLNQDLIKILPDLAKLVLSRQIKQYEGKWAVI